MSGVGEALAIVSCVAGLIQAYDAASRRIEKIKKSRAQRQAPPPPVDLETSVERGKLQIVEVVKEGRERFGDEFEHGDEEVQLAMLRITVATQAELLEGLAAGREDDDSVDFRGCIDASDTGRRKALVVLNEYIMRKTREERERVAMRKSEQPAESMQRQERQVQDASRSLPAVQRGNTMRTVQPPSEPAPAAPAAPEASKSRRFPFLRSASTATEPRPVQATRPAPITVQSDEPVLTTLHARSLSGMTLVSNGSRRTTGRRTSSPQGRATASISSSLQMSPGSNLTSGSTSPRSASMSESSLGAPSITSYGGCCKYAHHLRDGKISKSLGRQNLAVSPGAINFNFRCKSTKCSFQIPSYQNKKRNWVVDDRPRIWKGKLQYTPVFLAKSHIPTLVPLTEQKTNAQYRCMICILSHERASVFHGHDALLEHVLGHAGATLDGVKLQGPLSFSNDGVGVSPDFDINLPESEPDTVAQMAQPMHTSDAVADAELQYELEKLEISSKRSSHASQEMDPYYSPWAD